jgi:hypothetical protein
MIAWKHVSCLDPERASELGVPAEAPVFVSPTLRRAHECPTCGVTFTPLVYAPGHVTRAQHARPECPGIFHWHRFPAYEARGPFILAGAVDCGRLFDDSRATEFRGEVLLALCLGCQDADLVGGRAAAARRDGAWRMWRLGNTDWLAPVCEACAGAGVGLPTGAAPTPWVLTLRDGQPTWRWLP